MLMNVWRDPCSVAVAHFCHSLVRCDTTFVTGRPLRRTTLSVYANCFTSDISFMFRTNWECIKLSHFGNSNLSAADDTLWSYWSNRRVNSIVFSCLTFKFWTLGFARNYIRDYFRLDLVGYGIITRLAIGGIWIRSPLMESSHSISRTGCSMEIEIHGQ
jgi:hypothetical protein